MDEREYAIAKELDPKDPTPWFYDAIAKQTTNRPVEALRDYQKAIELNDNRAVYRSKLSLDSDLAARSAALGRIYSDLGFQQLALVEGWKSVNTDPTNFSSHRFLADSYSVLPRHEIARVSELLQSQLLQPINISPIQPKLAEKDLFLISAQGPGGISFNEFNPIFNRDRIALQLSALGGENSTWAGEGVASGIYKNLSFSAGYSGFETDGFRANDDQRDQFGNVFAQYALSPNTSIQGEYRYRDNKRGDTDLRFFPDDYVPDLRQSEQRETYRFGFRHSFTPDSTVIGNFSYNKVENGLSGTFLIEPFLVGLPGPPPAEDFLRAGLNEHAYSGELQHLFRSQYVNTVAGVGFSKMKENFDFTEDYSWPPFFLGTFTDKYTLDIEHINMYVYSYLNLIKNVTFTVGASGDFYDQKETEGTSGSRDQHESQVNPKFGVTWNPIPSTTLRGALFRTLRRVLVTEQTIEPTQVAGFNQFYDDINATETWVYGAAVDQKFSQNLYGGFEYTYRDLEVPYFTQPAVAAPFVLNKVDWDESLYRAYLYWTPHDWVALRAEYQYEHFERGQENTEGIKNLRTSRVPLGLTFFHPSGISFGVTSTYVHQKGEFERQAFITGAFESGSDDFWLFDAAISYRLPNRYGFITVGVKNIFDKEFQYAETDFNNATIQPDRFFFCKVTLAIP